jgi:hypothetical protein
VIGVVILRIVGFITIRIIGFDPIVVEVGDIAISMQYSKFQTMVAMWLKTRKIFDGRQWSVVQHNEIRLFFVSPWPFEST